MKMSFFWSIIFCIDVINVVVDISKNDFGVWFYIDIVLILLAAWLYRDARQREAREAAAKRQLINVFINNTGNTTAEEVAKRAAEQLKYDL